ncbi:hypothetical protein HALO59_160067 [Halomonas sp. 59]|nr:hypothetical protein HALO113_160709 [Halomonas sp. 113]CAD5264587.1 hypothetical protein HALO59_160067 [Halomonas sp. 59]CAD5277454.1 hypothetical protein HALOI3_210067 [Halomonas sp. I3]CAD5285564.1 hypothetical protein HALO156_30124 [Halomonas sp. 156]VXB50827.1 hypothetical protein HALO98_170067 [Halomonas titanicae]
MMTVCSWPLAALHQLPLWVVFSLMLHSYTLPFSFRARAQLSTEISLAQAAEVG